LRNTRDWWAWVTFERHRYWARVKLSKIGILGSCGAGETRETGIGWSCRNMGDKRWAELKREESPGAEL